jgi:hypothetical protein
MVVDTTQEPGLWVVDILTGESRYISVPKAVRDAALRWSVLLTTLVPVDGVWRTGAAVMHLSPAEGDMVAELAFRGFDVIGQAIGIAGLADPSPMPAPGRQRPYGVFATSGQQLPPNEAAIANKIFGILIPSAFTAVHTTRAQEPRVMNTDGDTLVAATVYIRVADPDTARRTLLTHPDIEEGDIDEVHGRNELLWWGREMADDELETMRAKLAETGGGEEQKDDEGWRHWLRGRIYIRGMTLYVNTNSHERVEAFVRLIGELGLDPDVVKYRFFDRPLDLSIRRGTPLPYERMSWVDLVDWVLEWTEAPMPGLPGLSPGRAVRRPDNLPIVEAALRELEHDAEARMEAGLLVPDVDDIRQSLGMPVGAWLGLPRIPSVDVV